MSQEFERHLDAIAAAHQNAARTVRELVGPLPQHVVPLEAKLRATIAMAEVAAAIAVARGIGPQQVLAQAPARRCEATKDGARCVRVVALDKIGICEGPHDYGVLPDNVVPLRPRTIGGGP